MSQPYSPKRDSAISYLQMTSALPFVQQEQNYITTDEKKNSQHQTDDKDISFNTNTNDENRNLINLNPPTPTLIAGLSHEGNRVSSILKLKSTNPNSPMKRHKKTSIVVPDDSNRFPVALNDIIEEEKEKTPDKLPRIVELLHKVNFLIKVKNVFRSRTSLNKPQATKDDKLIFANDLAYNSRKLELDIFVKKYLEKNTFKKFYYQMMFYCKYDKYFGSLSNKCLVMLNYLNNQIPVIKPNQKIKILWDILILIIICFYFFVIPLQISFDIYYDDQFEKYASSKGYSEHIISFILLIPEIIMITDTTLKFITGYYENGIIIMSKEKIIKKYLKKGLIFDILSYCPILIQGFYKDKVFTNSSTGLLLKSLQLLVFCKMKRINTLLRNFEDVIVLNGKHDYLLNLVRVCFRIVFVAHINACVWHGIAYYNDSEYNWLLASELIDANWVSKYWNSLYWAVSVMVTMGVGDQMSPKNNVELFFGVAILLVSAFIFGYTLNSMRQIFDLMSRNETEFKETISIINQYMKKKNIDFELQGRVRKYLEYIMHKEKNSEKETEIISKLTESLQKEVLMESHGTILTKVPLFKNNFSAETVQNLSFKMRQCKFSPEEYIYHRNDIDSFSLYIVGKGDVEEIVERNSYEKRAIITKKKTGDIFGVRSFFTEEKREFSVVSKNFSTIFEINKHDFLAEIKKNPLDYEKFCMIRDELKFINSFQSFKIACPCCKSKQHFIDKCSFIHYRPDKDFIIKRFLYSSNQARNNAYSRNTKRRNFHALFDSNLIQEKGRLLMNDMSSVDSDSGSEVSEEPGDAKEDLAIIKEIPEEKEEFEKLISKDTTQAMKRKSSDMNMGFKEMSIRESIQGDISNAQNNMLLDPLNIASLKKDRKKSTFLPMQIHPIVVTKRKSHQSFNKGVEMSVSSLKPPDFNDIQSGKRGSFLSATYSVQNASNAENDQPSSQNTFLLKKIIDYLDNFQSLHKNFPNSAENGPSTLALEAEDKFKNPEFTNNNAYQNNAELFFFDIDGLGLFSNYFPENGIERVLKYTMGKRSTQKRKSRHLNRRVISKSRGNKDKDECISP